MSTKNVLICEDHPVVNFGMKMLLEVNFSEFTLYQSFTYLEALDYFNKMPIDLLILDLNIPGGNSIKMLDSFLRKQPNVRILIFSAYDEKIYAIPCLRSGAKGYISKDAHKDEVIQAVHTVSRNEKYLSPGMKQMSIDKLINQLFLPSNPIENLSVREKEVLHYIVEGFKPTQIANLLNLHISSISTIKTRLYRKLGVDSLASLFQAVQLIQDTHQEKPNDRPF
ncbi:DNA-binding response regulator [Siphonobacter sp. BAB-5385]|uniref:response regulator transcription factor n=1 Tax=unclassified Siphonobacter TaxID=2635712 RepID=UPI000B9E39CE|nr:MULTISPECIES: response regulator transcription factor [unclassified Siphonobacter]OZI09778.1 DNA-binding response regulator [Siphonobacter sp. BAB-5385]PMD92353.1 DNA-binding response regulator [Siphonobacter sp. BAB-5405]